MIYDRKAVPIIAISAVAFAVEVIFWIKIALTRHDVSYTANSAACDNLETRNSLYYPARYLKFWRINQRCEVPQGLILAKQAGTAGPSYLGASPYLCEFFPQVLPILFITIVGGIIKVGAMIRLAFVKDDVWFTKDSAHFEYCETRQGPWYRPKSRKWGGRDYYEMPRGLILAKQGDVNGPSYSEGGDKKVEKDDKKKK
ncbi:hypothetical protein M5D96_000806 [Drosophila gunungcola]|uniref:Uncharacterized protein n=1 Tax=Drosophila gunungcola TaxID=103775 RepID=A0A9P9YWV3_9MUSC|nr:hypothetical protein M5D96_000806 [Drosophila gunungcola]